MACIGKRCHELRTVRFSATSGFVLAMLNQRERLAPLACMSNQTYAGSDGARRQAARLVAGRGQDAAVFSSARVEAGMLLRRLQERDRLGMPHSRSMPGVGQRCHELRVVDAGKTWRIVYRLDPDAVVIADVFQKTTQQSPVRVIQDCRRRLAQYDAATGGD
jgi:phage-related protein